MSSAERKTKVDRCHDLPISRQCEVLAISRSSAYRAPAGLSVEELDLMRKLDELHLRYPFKGSRRLRDDLWDVHGLQVNRKRVQRLMRIMGIRALLHILVRKRHDRIQRIRSILICCGIWRLSEPTTFGALI